MIDLYVTDILKMCMKKFNAEKYFFTNLQGFNLHIAWGVYCKPCLQPISCLNCTWMTILVCYFLIMPSTLKKWGTYWFWLVRMCVCIHVRDIVLKLHVWIPHGEIADAYLWFSLNYLPLSIYGPLTNKGMKFCKCRISKSIIARNLKLVMLVGDDD